MPHQGQHRPTAPDPGHQDLGLVLDWLLAHADLSAVRFRTTCTWTPRGLVSAALLWALSGEAALLDRFRAARSVARACPGLAAGEPAATYQAFLKILRGWTAALAAILAAALRRRMREDLADRFEVAGFAAFAVDGSRLQLPRTASNQARFAAAGSGPKARRRGRLPLTDAELAARRKKAESPLMWLTTVWHLGTGLPWAWRTGADDSSEREHLRRMVGELPGDALVVADAGFVGYETFAAVIGSGRHLLVRVGGNVRLLRGLGHAELHRGLVHLWPDDQASHGRPPLALRLVVVRGDRHPIYLVTSVLDEARLPDGRVAELYRMRWGVELFYRHFKQSFGRRKLRSGRAENAEVEAAWSLLGLWAAMLHGQVELSFDGVPASRVGVAGLLRAYRGAMVGCGRAAGPGGSIRERLAAAVIDGYRRRSKASRDYPRRNQTRPAGAPRIREATPEEVERAARIMDSHPSRLTA